MKRFATIAGLAIALSVSGTVHAEEADGILSFGMGFSQATVVDDGRTFRIYMHPHKDRFLMQPAMNLIASGAPNHWPIEFWRRAAEQFVQPLGCGISDVVAVSQRGASWEAFYVCPTGVDLHALVAAQKADLKQGNPIHP